MTRAGLFFTDGGMTIKLLEHPTTEATEPTGHDETVLPTASPAPPRGRNRRRLTAAAAVVATATVLLAAALVGGGSPDDTTEVRSGSAGPRAGTNAIVGRQPQAEPPGSAAVMTPRPEPAPPEAGSAPVRAAAPARPAAPAPAPAPSCRDSTDPACGPFRWDPAPAANQPLTTSFDVSPAHPRAGEVVTVRVVAVDPDAPVTTNGGTYFWDDPHFTGAQVGFPLTVERTPDRYGPWTPPRPEPGRLELSFTHTFSQPGTYRFGFQANSGAESDPGNLTAHPYANWPEVTYVHIVVSPAGEDGAPPN